MSAKNRYHRLLALALMGVFAGASAAPVFAGTPSPPAFYFTVAPCRVLDTRSGPPLPSGIALPVQFRGVCGVPPAASALMINATVTNPTGGGHLTLFPLGSPKPLASSINFSAGQTRSGNAVAVLSAGGEVAILPFVTASGNLQLVVDVFGYFVEGIPPTAVDDAATVSEDDPATAIDVLANDTDPDGGTKLIASATDPANGTVVLTGGTPGNHTGLTYQPDPNYCNAPPGTTLDTFSHTLTPGGSTATVTVTVTCVDDLPTAVNDSATVMEDSGANAIDVLANDTDPDGGTNTITAVQNPSAFGGTVLITGGGTGVTYAPAPNYCNNPPGTTLDTFTYSLTPGGST